MVPARTHYGIPGTRDGTQYRAACGHLRRRVTIDRALVTCQRCRETRHFRHGVYATGEFSPPRYTRWPV